MVHWKNHVRNNGELNQSQYSFYIWYLSSNVCDVFSKVLAQFVAEPQTGLQIAFKMLDADGNEQVEKKEFFKVGVYTYVLILNDLNRSVGYICSVKIH